MTPEERRPLLRSAHPVTKLPAQDLDRAQAFYRDQLGLEPIEERPGGARYLFAGGEFHLFQTSGAPSGSATQIGLEVEDLDAAMAELRARGVTFAEFDGIATVDGVVDVAGNYPSKGTGERGAWFYDSEGNLIGLAQATG